MIFLFLLVEEKKYKIIIVAAITTLLFIYEFIPIQNKIAFSLNFILDNYVPLILFAILFGILIKNFNNIYLICITIFSILWVYFLCFGSSSKIIVNLLFAANYDTWGGFFTSNKLMNPFLFSGYLIISIIVIFISKGLKIKS